MWKRLIKSKKNRKGYTLTELLVVIGIIAVVCAIAIPSVIAISRSLRFKQRNDYAKSIFMAAQQNLTEMRSDGGLGPLQESDGAGVIPAAMTSFPDEFRDEYVYTTTGTDAFNLVLPVGSIDASVRGEQIIIEYNPLTGNVYAVFYSEERDSILGGYTDGSLPRDDETARKKMMLGYYDGSGLSSSEIELEKTQAMVQFTNTEEGIITVMVPMPDSFFGSSNDFITALEVNLTITGEYSMLEAAADPDATEPAADPTTSSFNLTIKNSGTDRNVNGDICTLGVDGKTVMVEFPIDSLADQKSFANYASGTAGAASLTSLMDESAFKVLPGENITIQADVTFDGGSGIMVQVDSGILSGVNPMFEYLQPSGNGGYVLAVSNGRNLQNLNALAPTIAQKVESVVFTSDIYWNDTVSYYNSEYGVGGATYISTSNEAPARSLPYFVPIHHEDLFGTARFIFPDEGDGGLGSILESLLNGLFGGYSNSDVPTLTDEMDTVTGVTHAAIEGNGHKVFNINIDSTQYQVPNEGKTGTVTNPETNEVSTTDLTGTFYATGDNQIVDYCFTGLFGYINTTINDLHVVNPIVKGHEFTKEDTVVQKYIYIFGIPFPNGTETVSLYNNPATGALIGAGGYNTLVSNCSTYIDKDARGYMASSLGHGDYSKDTVQTWYGVSGEGAVGGLVGYAKSHRSVSGELTNSEAHLAFYSSFAAVPVSGNMRGTGDKDFGYSNGVGGLIGNSQLTNFYNCYASGDVRANGCYVKKTTVGSLLGSVAEIFGMKLDLLYNGRVSTGAGGFVGTSHGTRYTNCFATGDVSAAVSGSSPVTLGAGGFVGFMSIDETFEYGNDNSSSTDQTEIAQRTVFTNCYSVGKAVTAGTTYENFSGANGRIKFNFSTATTYSVGDYYRLYAPHYANNNQTAPDYEDVYIYRDAYFLASYHTSDANAQENSSSCAEPEPYSTFTDLPGNHTIGSDWMTSQIDAIKAIKLDYNWSKLEYYTYETKYFDKYPALNTIYKELYDEGFSYSDWEPATASTTHPYSTSTSGATYPFSKLKGLDYYGDWPSKPSDVGMAYYETYKDTGYTHYFFDKEHDDDVRLSLRSGEDLLVVDDGYAIFSASDASLEVTVGNVSDTLTATGNTLTVSNKVYHVFPLSEKLMAALPSDGEFYVKVTASHAGGNTYTMYFNPNVALSHVNPSEGATTAAKPDSAPKTIYIRSARQFAGISTLEDFWGKEYSYIQQLNIDAEKYEWTNADIGSIGNSEHPFNASYTTAGGYVTQAKLSGFTLGDAGFFGVVGENGKIENLLIECENISAGDANTANVAVLAGSNAGTITNVDLNLNGTVTLTAKENAGLVAGYSSGTIADCDVVAAKAVTINAPNAGGIVGSAAGTAEDQAAVTNCTLELKAFTAKGTNAGAMFGSADYTAAEKLTVEVSGMTITADSAGALAGVMKDSTVTTAEITLTGTNKNEQGIMAGAVGTAKDTVLTAVNVTMTTGTLSGDTAVGLVGVGANADVKNSVVTIGGTVSGTAMAAGVAGSIDADSVFDRVPVTLTGAKITSSAGDAAGYAIEIKGNVLNSSVTLGDYKITKDSEGNITSRTATNKTTISANMGEAAGYAITVGGFVDTGSVLGAGTITGAKAAGFAVNVAEKGQIAASAVTPALSKDAYFGNSNSNLTVNGTDEAAGFALTVGSEATISNSYTLCAVTGTNAYGFVGTNGGTITGSTANVNIGAGYAFVGTNNGLVARCYGWYGEEVDTGNVTTAELGGTGKCYSAYFGDLDRKEENDENITLYAADGTVQVMTAASLQGSAELLAGSSYTWRSGYAAYPYTTRIPETYLYPMLRDHYGDWTVPPQYAYGVAYYETYTDGSVKIHLMDLSDSSITVEKGSISNTVSFDNSSEISDWGYAVFAKAGTNPLGDLAGEKLENITYDLNGRTYEFYALTGTGVVDIPATAVSANTATVNTYYADAINDTDGTYEIRTPEQLANIGKTSANYTQTHDITTADFTTTKLTSEYSYNGNNLRLVVTGQANTWLSEVGGAVENLNLVVTGGVNKPIFGKVSGTVNLGTVSIDTIGADGALVNESSGTVNTGAITVSGAISGKLFGDVSGKVETGVITVGGAANQIFGTVNGGSVTTGAISTNGATAQVFGDITANTSNDNAVNVASITTNGGEVTTQVFGAVGAPVTVNGEITTGAVNGKVFGDVSSKVTATKISTGAVSGQIFGNVTGSVTTNGITVNGDATKLFGNAAGTVQTGAINVTGTLKQAFGTISADVTVNGISAGKIAADTAVIAEVKSGKVSTGTITTGSVSGMLIGGVSGGSVTLGDITINGVTSTVSQPASTDPTGSTGATEITTTTTYSDVGTLFGAITGGTVSGAKVELGKANIVKPLFTSVTNGTVEKFQITTVGSLNASLIGGDLAGTLSGVKLNCGDVTLASNGVLVSNMTSGTIESCEIKAGNVTSTATTFGGITGTVTAGEIKSSAVNVTSITLSANDLTVGNAMFGGIAGNVQSGTLTNNTVSATMNVTGKAGSLTVVGGMIGINNGTISGGDAAVTVNYTQKTETTDTTTVYDQVGIGGIVGWMQSGSVNGATASGAINLNEGGSGNGRSMYFIGGAVAYAETDVSNVQVKVEIDKDWAYCTSGLPNMSEPAGMGSVGMFVGCISSGTITNCSSTADNGTADTGAYQFLGQIAHTKCTDLLTENMFSGSEQADSYETELTTSGQLSAFASEKQLVPYTSGTYITFSKVTLTNCSFKFGDNTYYQKILPDTYFYLGAETTVEGGYVMNEVTEIARTIDKYSSISSGTLNYYDTFGTTEKTMGATPYYYNNNGVYEPVYVTITEGKYIKEVFTYTLYANSNKIDEGSYISKLNKGKVSITLYTKSTIDSLNADVEYLITDSSVGYYFDGDSSGGTISKNTKGNISNSCYAALTLWKVDTNGNWTNGNSNLYMKNSGTTFVSSTEQPIAVTKTTGGFTLFGYDRYLTNSTSSFGLGSSGSALRIFTLSPESDSYKYTLTCQPVCSYSCVATDEKGNIQNLTAPVSIMNLEKDSIEATLPAGETTGGETQEPNA